MPRYLRFLLLIAGFVPYVVKLPYIMRAWDNSPQDRLDWVFVLLFAILFPLVWMLTRKRKEVAKADFYVLIVLLPAVFGYAASIHMGINAIQIICGIAIAYSVFWLIYGGQNAYRVLPAFALLGLGVTSTTYWINHYFDSSQIIHGFVIKAVFTGFLLLWLLVNYLREKQIETKTLLFGGAVCVASFLIWQSSALSTETGPAIVLNLSEGKVGPYLGQSQEVTAEDIRFFGEDSEVEKFYYIGSEDGIYVLAITCGEKINSIHPASHCLRSSGWTVVSEEIIRTGVSGPTSNVNEVIAEDANGRYVFWVWYTNMDFSTASFVHFRKKWKRDEIWRTYQVMVPLRGETSDVLVSARTQLREFIGVFAE